MLSALLMVQNNLNSELVGVEKISPRSSSTLPFRKALLSEKLKLKKFLSAPSTIWEKTKHAAGIPRSFFRQYYKGRPQAVAYKLRNVIAYETPKALSDYGITHVPQSFIYIEDEPC